MATSWTPAVSDLVGGRYRLLSKIGQGAMGTVFRAEHISLGSQAAVKVIDPDILARAGSEQIAELEHRFLREARAAASLNSAHVVRVLDYGIERGAPYIAMELLEGELLADLMDRTRVVSTVTTFKILSEVSKAVARGHEAGIIHRDLKPENIFLARVDDQVIAKVLDFGIAKMAKSPIEGGQRTTRRGELIGTPSYMSPEQLTGKEVDQQADIWAVAVMAFECLTGRLPFQEEAIGALAVQVCTDERPIPSAIGNVPPGFDEWWLRAAKKDPSDRFSNVREAIEELGLALGLAPDIPISLRGPTSSPESNRGLDWDDQGAAPRARSAPLVRSTQATMSAAPRPRVSSGLLGGGLVIVVASAVLATWLFFRSSPTHRPAETTAVATSRSEEPSPSAAVTVAAASSSSPSSSSPSTPPTPSASASAERASDTAPSAADSSAQDQPPPVKPPVRPRPRPGRTDPRLGL